MHNQISAPDSLVDLRAGGRITVIAHVYHPLSEADRPVCPATAHSKDAPLFDEDQLYSLAELL